jgi:NADPH-dependent 2,4-dienoyl-CoA reductase/sulfur reductase-like enzyme
VTRAWWHLGITRRSVGGPSWPLGPTRKACGRRYVAVNDTDCRVLAVGAGPTGLVLAAELLTRGIGTCNIDKGRDNK